MTRPCIVVAGMGRCGTSLMMQMLSAAGVRCVGPWPSFETETSAIGEFDPISFAGRTDQAIKLIDPFRLAIGDMPNHVVIWLDRNPREQAKSQVKLLFAGIGTVPNRRIVVRSMDASLRRDRARNRASVGIPGGIPHITVRFEDLIETPHFTAGEIVAFLHGHGWKHLDSHRMAAQVRRRSTQCLPDLIEIHLLAERGAA